MNKILLTGSHGYIGNHLRHIITGFDCIDIQLGNDILDPDLDISQYDTIIHLAAWVQVGQSVENPTDYYHNNINGTLNLLKKFQGSHFIFASTGAAANSLNSPYAISKKVCEDIIQEQAIKNGFNFTIFRFFNVIGSAFGLNPTNPDGLFHALKTAQSRGYFNIYGHDYTVSYIISPQGARKVLAAQTPIKHTADAWYYFGLDNAFRCKTQFVRQNREELDSTINNNNSEFKFKLI